ncbi:MAG: methylated-DNA--[protein]-cysteine S-methyltransferase [Anaerolineales bacterium]|nr:methylated-DNA--[protein]-cysteine S-methyltransferase [Anaerolineales bacterium]
MTNFHQPSEDYRRVEQAILYLERNARRQPDLAEVAAHVGLSEYHFQRLFSRWAGISPKRFLQYLTKEYAKALLAQTPVLETAHAAGLSSPGRLHDLLVQTEAVTPGEIRSGGTGVEISYGFHPTPFGECLLAATGRGICHLAFVDEEHPQALATLRNAWPHAALAESQARTGLLVEQVFAPRPGLPLSIHLRGTNFQIKVWEALLGLAPGEATSYGALARQVSGPGAERAVGNAVGRNPVAYLIPCHRVLRQSGDFGEYRYGTTRKKAILGYEAAKR